MKLNELNKLPAAKRRKIVGRGPGSGMGKTCVFVISVLQNIIHSDSVSIYYIF